MKSPDRMLETFFLCVKAAIEDSGTYNTPLCHWHDRIEDKINFEILMMSPQDIMLRCINNIDGGTCSSAVFGLDMSSRPGQGLEFDDFVLVFEWRSERPEPLRNQLKIGVINYSKGPSPVVRPIDWENSYWIDHAFNLVKHFVPMRVRVYRKETESQL